MSDGYGNRRVARFDGDLNFIGQWGSKGDGKGQFVLPHAVTTDHDGFVYIADHTNRRVQIFSPEGVFLRQWTHIGKPFVIVYGHDNHFYVCDWTNVRVTKVDRSEEIVEFFGSQGSGPEELSTAHDIAVNPNDDILVAHLDGKAQLFSIE